MHQAGNERVFDLSDPGLWIPAYHGINTSRKRFKLLYGSRGRGGSTNAAECIVMRMLEERFVGLMVRKVYEDIRGSQWETLRQLVCDEWKLEDEFLFPKAPLGVVCKATGAELVARGLDKPGRAKSVPGLSLAWYEEADEMTAEDFKQTSLSIRGDNIEEWMTFNAPGIDHWILKRFFPGTYDKDGKFHVDLSFEREDGMFVEVPSTDPDAHIAHGCYKHNPFTKPAYIKQMEREKEVDPEGYRVNGLGLIGMPKTGKEFFWAFKSNTHVRKGVYDPLKPLHIGLDFNRAPYMTLVVSQVRKERIGHVDKYVVQGLKEYCLSHPFNTTEAVCKAFLQDTIDGAFAGHRSGLYVYGDYSGKTAKTSTVGGIEHDYDVVWHVLDRHLSGVSDRVIPNPPHRRVSKWVNDTFNGLTSVAFYFDPSMSNSIRDFQSLKEDADGSILKEKVRDPATLKSMEKGGHCAQANYYIWTSLFHDSFEGHR